MRNGLEIDKFGNKFWYKDGKRHREDGPAVEYTDGYTGWWINGKRHREDGPAIIRYDGYKRWFINDLSLTEVEFNEWQIENRKSKIEVLEL